jgi:cytoskeleton protein RodZ
MPVNADSLGSYLRQERALRQVSLQDISAATKIQLRFLEALEGDRYDQLPPAPFTVGFLRAYAQCLLLEPEEIIAAYHARQGTPESHIEGQRLLMSYPVERPGHVGRDWRSTWTGLRLLVICGAILAGLAFYILRYGPGGDGTRGVLSQTMAERALLPASGGSESSAVVSTLPSPPPERGTQALQTPGSTTAPDKPTQAVPTAAEGMSPAAAADAALPERLPEKIAPVEETVTPLALQAAAVADTWLRVEIDGDKRQDILLASGKSVRWEARERVVMTVGNARGIRLTLNGKDIQLPATRGNVVRDFLVTRALLN